MEQWLADGRTIVRDRNKSLIPVSAESEGFGEDITQGLRGILKKVVRPGSERRPVAYAECHCRYAYRNVERVLVETSDEPIEVVLGAGQVTQGFDETLATMTEGEVAAVWLDPAFAFRENGCRSPSGSILPDQPVLLEIELVRFYNPMSPQEKLSVAEELKMEGSRAFSNGRIDEALKRYHEALRKIGPTSMTLPEVGSGTATVPPEERRAFRECERLLRATILTNIATCCYSKEDNDRALTFCNRALAVAPDHAKALYRKALVLERRCDFDGALGILALMVDKELGVRDEVLSAKSRIETKNTTYATTERKMTRQMFGS